MYKKAESRSRKLVCRFIKAKIVNNILMCEQKDEKMQCNQF